MDTMEDEPKQTEESKVEHKEKREKKNKHLKCCHKLRKDVMTLVYSVDGVAGRKACWWRMMASHLTHN